MFNSSLKIAVLLLIPPGLRKPRLIAWLSALVSMVEDMRLVFTSYRSSQLYFIAHNSQVIYLEHILNNKFNPDGNSEDPDYEGNGIYITDGQTADDVFIFNTSEAGDDTFIFNTSEAEDDTFLNNNTQYGPWIGFVVNVPDSFTINENEMKALLNKLKLAGKNYTINYYTI